MEKKLFTLALLLFFGKAFSQNITGTVLNAASGEAMAGVSISVANSDQGTFTAEDGSFSLQIKSFPVRLQLSAIGFESRSFRFTDPASDEVLWLSPEAEALSEVVLRSTIIPKEVRETPASVSVLTAADLQRYDETNVLQAVNSVAGVNVLQGALNTNKISIRGIGARSQYSTNRVKAYFEDIPLSTAEGETTLDDLDPSIIGRTEIIKGPASSVYGAGLGGVINLYAADPEEEGTRALAGTTFGSFGMMKNRLQTTYASGSTNLLAAFNHLETDSFRENGDFERNSFSLHGRVTGNETSSLSVLAQFIRLKAYIPSSINREQLDNDPSSAAFTWKAAQGFESYDKGLFGLSYKHKFSQDLENTTSVFMNFRDAWEPRPFDILKEEQVATGLMTRFNYNFEIFTLPSEISVGAEIYREWYDTATFENLYEDFPDRGSLAGNGLSNNSQDRHYYNLFGQWNMSLSEVFEVEAGLNVNSTAYELTDLFHRDEVDQTGEYSFDPVLSPRVGLLYRISTNKNIYTSVSHGFSIPTVAETLTPEGLINTSLQPETGINYEVGFKGNWINNKLYTELAVFSIQINDLLVAERIGEDQYVGRNIGKTDHNGIEFLLNYRTEFSTDLTADTYVNGSLNFYRFDEFMESGVDFSGNRIPGVPDRTVNAGVDFSFRDRLHLYTSFQHVGEMPLNDENSGYNDSYNIFHLKTSYEFTFLGRFQSELFAGVNNLFDEHYAASIIPNAVGFGGSAPRYFYPGNPRNYYGGINLSYRF